MRQLEQQTGICLPDGYNADVCFMSHLWDPLRTSHKPLLFYIGTEFIAFLTYIILCACGFKRHYFQGAVFYTLHLERLQQRSAAGRGSSDSSGSRQEPLLFIHGVGTGLLPYLLLVLRLVARGG